MSFFKSSSSGGQKAAAVLKTAGFKDQNLQVEKKLRKIKKYKGADGSELQVKAEEITNPELILHSFSHITEQLLFDQFGALHEDKKDACANSVEVANAKSREVTRLAETGTIPLKIVSRELDYSRSAKRVLHSLADFMHMDFGAKHVALVVGNVVLEWGKESLVIPRPEGDPSEADDGYEIHDLTGHIPHNVEAGRNTLLDDQPLLPIVDEMRLMVELTDKKITVFEELAKEISKYNKKYSYNILNRNCQNFVKDALKALGISKISTAPKTSEHMLQLKKKKLEEIPDNFSQHEDLDEYIKSKPQAWLEKLNHDSLEYLQLWYQQFHGDAPCRIQGSCRESLLLELTAK